VIRLTHRAIRQLSELLAFYEGCERREAMDRLFAAVSDVSCRIEQTSVQPLPAPRRYPQLAYQGWRWLKQGSYWFAFDLDRTAIQAIIHESADIPNRMS
jgi:hypothetical protein